ncbi:MAG TPA: hypothetical protein VFK69_06425, partial [Candidatus Eisenbacteria bacterium]|nr:hypothetical protein [Candidatus Eisenbacteria bacterium]
MRLRSIGFALAALVIASPALARTSIYVNFGAPPPPVVVFRSEPEWVLVPGTDVYCIADYEAPGYDEYFYDGWCYVYSDGWWYRARSWRGPFYAIYEDYVPAAIWYVPTAYWHTYPRHISYERERWARMGWHGYRGGGFRGGEAWRGGTAYRGGSRGGGTYRAPNDVRWRGATNRGPEFRGGGDEWRGRVGG